MHTKFYSVLQYMLHHDPKVPKAIMEYHFEDEDELQNLADLLDPVDFNARVHINDVQRPE